jgi:hypothetical protein
METSTPDVLFDAVELVDSALFVPLAFAKADVPICWEPELALEFKFVERLLTVIAASFVAYQQIPCRPVERGRFKAPDRRSAACGASANPSAGRRLCAAADQKHPQAKDGIVDIESNNLLLSIFLI